MANSSAAAKTSYHTRSISFPSRAHPHTASLEDQLCRLKASSAASTSSSAICHNVGLVNDLYKSFDDFLQLPHAQQALSQYQEIEKALDGSPRLLDICSMSKDALIIIKESLQKIESSLRRRKGGKSSLADEVQNIQISRKNVKRIVKKCFKNISEMESCKKKVQVQGKNLGHVPGDVEAVSLPILLSILSFVLGTEAKSLLSKLMPSKQTGKKGEVVEKMDQALEALKGEKTGKI